MLLSQPQDNDRFGIMCFTMPKSVAASPPRRRLTFNAHGTEAMSSLKRALNLALFITPTVIHLGDGAPGGKKDIYLSAAIQRSLRKLFNDLRRSEPTLARKYFLNFLIEEQKEAGDQAPIKLIRETYTFEQFLEVWWMQFGLTIEKPVCITEKDLTKPISNYFIDSSHNTYLSGNQLSGKATTETYKRVLRQGCRCVEIDVWNNDIAPSPEKSRAGSTKGSSRGEHSRHLSASGLHTAAAHIKGAVDEKIDQTRQLLGVEKVHSHSPRCSKSDISAPEPGRENGAILGLVAATLDRADGEQPAVRSKLVLPRDEPIVMHGFTFNQPIGFRQVCKAIREAAFDTTHLPIIISLEVHADQEQQEKMVQIMREEWAGLLVEKPYETCPNGTMPRLEDLLDKILIKVKKAPLSTESSTSMPSLSPGITVDDDTASGSEDDRMATSKRTQPKVLICENLSKLAVYTHSEHFVKFDSTAAKTPSHIFSISENKILELWESKRDELFAHNRNFFMRAYPKASRWDSSNPDPSLFWRKGVQMVAMNWQKWDDGMMLNKAMFSGEQGWVLKPPGYRSSDGDPTGSTTCYSDRTFDLIVTVLAGQHIPLPEGMPRHKARSLRPLVKCELHVEKAEERLGTSTEGGTKLRTVEWKRQTGSGRTDHPEFDPSNRELCFMGIHKVVETLSFVRFRIENEQSRVPYLKETFAGWACIRLDRLATGYRLVPLLDRDGNETEGILLVKVLKNYR
ncbi:PLC-like phosphodiesterase [Xylariaceae sp. FL1651]|nr:PLC-like phosphodiesterase [Xylariaceae sp. FL1651]